MIVLFCRAILIIASVVFVSACNGSDDFVPNNPSGPTIPTIGGTYSSPTMWRFELTPDTRPQTVFMCAGSVTIGTQLGDAFSGSFLIQDPVNCGELSGSLVSGILRPDGGVSFELTVPGANSNLLTAAFACTYVSGDRGLSGTLVGRQLQAESRTVMDCPQVGRSTLFVRISGAR